jgi:hypothetical protein
MSSGPDPAWPPHLAIEREYTWWLDPSFPEVEPGSLGMPFGARMTQLWSTAQSTLILDDETRSLARSGMSLSVVLRHARDASRAWMVLKETLTENGGRRDALQVEQELEPGALDRLEELLDPDRPGDRPAPIALLHRRGRRPAPEVFAVLNQRRRKLRARSATGTELVLSVDQLAVFAPDAITAAPVAVSRSVELETEAGDPLRLAELDDWAAAITDRLKITPGGPSKAARAAAALAARAPAPGAETLPTARPVLTEERIR